MVFWISKERNQILLVIPHIFIFYFFLSIFCELDMLEIWLHLIKKNTTSYQSKTLNESIRKSYSRTSTSTSKNITVLRLNIKEFHCGELNWLRQDLHEVFNFLASIHCLPSTNVLINIKEYCCFCSGDCYLLWFVFYPQMGMDWNVFPIFVNFVKYQINFMSSYDVIFIL